MALQYTVVKDTKEKKGWTFAKYRNCLGCVDRGLKTGDYTVEGLEDVLCVERKGLVQEFAQNVVQARFDKELERMREFKYAFIILEFDMEDLLAYPYGCLPKYLAAKCKYTGRFVLKKVVQIMLAHHNIHIVFAGNSGKEVVSQIFKDVVEAELGT